MGRKESQNKLLALIFWFKALFAVLLSSACIAYLAFQVFDKFDAAQKIRSEAAVPIVIDGPQCQFKKSERTLGRLEPEAGRKMLGFHLTWDGPTKQQPLDIKQTLGRNPAIFNAFLVLDEGNIEEPFRFETMIWHGEECARLGSIFQLTIECINPLTISDAILEKIARHCADINSKGVPILLRYGHEMNGPWTSYGMQPHQYTTGFRNMANKIRAVTNMTAMVWSPNVANNYPNGKNLPVAGQKLDPTNPYSQPDPFWELNSRLLDTNNNALFDEGDDPYMPYYPGDDYVDWVGLSLYWYPDANTGWNKAIPPREFLNGIEGASSQPQLQKMHDFYLRFASANNTKPMMISETGAPFFDVKEDPTIDTSLGEGPVLSEAAIKQQWVDQLYSPESFEKFPLLKAIIHFEEKKKDNQEKMRDWRLLENLETRQNFVNTLDNLQDKLLLATDLKYACDGSIIIK